MKIFGYIPVIFLLAGLIGIGITFIEIELITVTDKEDLRILSGILVLLGIGLWIAHLKGWLK